MGLIMAEGDKWDKFLGDLESALSEAGGAQRKAMSRAEETKQLFIADQLRRKYMLPDDEEFADVLGTYMAGDIDPSIANHFALSDLPDGASLALRGAHNPSDEVIRERYDYEGIPIELSYEPGSVNALHKNNIPSTWSHEYRHRNYPELSERQNRFADMVAAQSDYDVDRSLRNYAHQMRYGGKVSENLEKITDVLETADLVNRSMGLADYAVPVVEKESGREYQDVLEDSSVRKFLQDAENLDEWNEGLSDRNKKRKAGKPESIIDAIRAAYEKLGL